MNAYHGDMNDAHDEAEVDLRQVDLNLLVAFDALAREKSVTRAAQRLGITQSAMSHALRRLRDLFGDPLVVRTGAGLVLTPRAEEVSGPLRGCLKGLGTIVFGKTKFDPGETRRTFRMAGPDLLDLILLPRLQRKLEEDAPHAALTMAALPKRIDLALESGEIDVCVVPHLIQDDAPFGPELPPHLMRKTIARDRMVAYLRKGHPFAGGRKLSHARYLALRHVLVSMSGEGPGLVDAVLARQGERRVVALRVGSFGSALAALAESDLVLTAPGALALAAGVSDRFAALSLPIELPEHAVSFVWHERFSADPGHAWFRDLAARLLGQRVPRR